MAVAMIYPDRTPRGKSSVSEGITYERVNVARTVLKWAPELAPQVHCRIRLAYGARRCHKMRDA